MRQGLLFTEKVVFLHLLLSAGQSGGSAKNKLIGSIMAEFKTNVMRILDKEGIDYTAHEYPHGKDAVDGLTVANLLGEDPACVFKTLVTRGDSGAFFVFVVPVESELDLKKCAKSVGEKHVEMIHVKDINKVTGYVRGGCSPVGMKKLYVTTFHLSAREVERIIVSAGKIGYQIELAPSDLLALTHGQYADIVRDV